MKKVIIAFILLFLSICLLDAQNQTNLRITGRIFDNTTKEFIESASIRLLNAKDSSYVTGTVTDQEGKFSLKVKASEYILQVSFMGFQTQYFNISSLKNNGDLGNIYLDENGVMLNEALVTAKAVDILIKGDTVEYNADSYKVQESAVLEDLLKKLPGAEIDENGKITINGKEISKILVDGKEFFSDDPKVASKNLPAKMVEKLQVLDKKSDLAQLTGFDDGDEETVINLRVRPGMKEGLFGSLLGGYGSRERYEGNSMINYMHNNTQITFLGGLNNTNNAGFTDFATSMNNGGGPPRGVSFGANNGVATTKNIGLNFATEVKDKFKINGDIRYGSIDNDVKTERERIYDDKQKLKRMTSLSKGNNKSENFGTNFKMEWTPDSLTKIIFRPSVQYNKNKNVQLVEGISTYADEEQNFDYSQDSSFYKSDADGLKLNGDLTLNRKLNSKGRSITFQLTGGFDNTDTDGYNYSGSIFRFRNYPVKTDSTGTITNQRYDQNDKAYNWRASASYIEPLGKNNFIELEYSIQNNNTLMDKKVYNNKLNTRVDSVTRRIENDFLVQNVSLSFQSIRGKYNYTVGIGAEPSSTKTDIDIPNTVKKIIPRRNNVNIVPRARFNYIWSNRHSLRIDYKGTTIQPTTRQLFDGDYTNTSTNIERGNPNLDPSFNSRLTIRYHNFNPETASAFMVFGKIEHTLNDIVNISSWEGSKDVTTYRNVNGNFSANARVIFNTPLKNKKFSFNTMTYGKILRRNSFITQRPNPEPLKNRLYQFTIQENMGLRFTSDYFDFTTRGNVKFERATNNVSNNNKSTYDYGGYADFTIHLPWNLHIDSDLTYSTNHGYADGFSRNEWLWNASVSKDFLKAKNATVRVKMYDILKERSNISWSSGNGYNQYTRTNTINSYIMVNLVYRFQSFKGGAKMSDMQHDFRGEHGRGPGRGGRPN